MALLIRLVRVPGHTSAGPAGRAALLLLLLLGAVLGFFPPAPAASAAAPAREYQVKAVFLLNIARFVEWPPEVFADAASPILIGVLGEDPLGGDLDEAVLGEYVDARPLIVQRYHRLEDIESCHVLFVASSEAARLGEILAAMKNRATVTVSDLPGFARRGGMVCFVTERNKIRLRINVDVARAERLTFSSMLLRSAEIITTGQD